MYTRVCACVRACARVCTHACACVHVCVVCTSHMHTQHNKLLLPLMGSKDRLSGVQNLASAKNQVLFQTKRL